MTLVRPAAEADAPAIARVHIASWKTSYRGIIPDAVLDNLDATFERRQANWERFIAKGEILIVAEDDEAIVGFVAGGTQQEALDGFDSELHAIYLLQSVQGKGIGRKLFRAFATEAHQRDYKAFFLWVLDGNEKAISFYKALGGKPVGNHIYTSGGKDLPETAYGWDDIVAITNKDESS